MKVVHSIRILFLHLFLFPILAFSWNVSPQSLLDRIHTPPSYWMQQRIDQDLSLFEKGLSANEVAASLKNLKSVQGIEIASLVHIQFSHSKASYEPLFALRTEQIQALEALLSAIELIASICPLSDFDLILTLSPSFDRPLCLMNTTVPIFAVSKERHNRKVALIPRLWNSSKETLLHRISCEWSNKREIAFWRGFATDGEYRYYDWDFKPRAQLALFSKYNRDLIDAAIVPSPILDSYIARWIEELSLASPFVYPEEQCHFKYLLALDGKGAASSFEWQLFTQSLLFKADSNKIEWFYDALIPGTHYLTFRPEADDLADQILWAKAHDSEAKAIAENGSRFARENLLDEGALTYLYHLLKRYVNLIK
jgi:hypothetical protein